MTIFEQLFEAFHPGDGRLMTTAEIKASLTDRFGTNASSVIPSDYCYNRWNRGVAGHKPLFLRVGSAEYRYVGPDHPYTGLVFWRAKGAAGDEIIGERVNGILRLFESPAALEPVTESQDVASVKTVSGATEQKSGRKKAETVQISSEKKGSASAEPRTAGSSLRRVHDGSRARGWLVSV